MWLPAFSPFLTLFLRGFFFKVVKEKKPFEIILGQGKNACYLRFLFFISVFHSLGDRYHLISMYVVCKWFKFEKSQGFRKKKKIIYKSAFCNEAQQPTCRVHMISISVYSTFHMTLDGYHDVSVASNPGNSYLWIIVGILC